MQHQEKRTRAGMMEASTIEFAGAVISHPAQSVAAVTIPESKALQEEKERLQIPHPIQDAALTAKLRAMEAEIRQLQASLTQTERRDRWRKQLHQLPSKHALASDKKVAEDLWAEFQSRQQRGIQGPRSILIGDRKDEHGHLEHGRAHQVGINPKTYSKCLRRLQLLGAIQVKYGRTANGHTTVLVEPTENFWDPSAWNLDCPRNYGYRPRKDHNTCRDCGHPLDKYPSGTGEEYLCPQCGTIEDRSSFEPNEGNVLSSTENLGSTQDSIEKRNLPDASLEEPGSPNRAVKTDADDATRQVVTVMDVNNPIGGVIAPPIGLFTLRLNQSS